MKSLPLSVRRAPIRLAIVVLLSLLVASACYGVSLSPLRQALVNTGGGPPAGRGPGAAAKPSASATVGTTTDATTDASASTGSAATASRAAPVARPPGGGGRPASLSRGLPELAQNVGVTVVLMLIVTGVQIRLRLRHRPRARRSLA